MNFVVGDIVRYCGDTPSCGQFMKIVEIRDVVAHPVRTQAILRKYLAKVQTSRYLLTCVRADGQYRSFYHNKAELVWSDSVC